MSETASDPTVIERELDATRARLGGHLDQLQTRLSPNQIVDDVMAYVRSSEGAQFGRNLIDTVVANPLPAAVTGIGLAWLMATNARGNVTATGPTVRSPEMASPYGRAAIQTGAYGDLAHANGGYNDMTAKLQAAEASVQRNNEEPEHTYSERLATARGSVLNISRNAQDTATTYGERVNDAMTALRARAHDARDALGGALGGAGDAIGGAGNAIGGAASSVGAAVGGAVQSAAGQLQGVGGQLSGALSQSSRAAGDLLGSIGDSPALLGAIGLAAGALLGSLLPMSSMEEAQLRGVADQLTDGAGNVAQRAMHAGQAVASAAIQGGREAAGKEGLTQQRSPGEMVDAALSGELTEGASTVMHDALQAGNDALRREMPLDQNHENGGNAT